jgi:hypothetical protein
VYMTTAAVPTARPATVVVNATTKSAESCVISILDVQCSMLDVRCSMFDVHFFQSIPGKNNLALMGVALGTVQLDFVLIGHVKPG